MTRYFAAIVTLITIILLPSFHGTAYAAPQVLPQARPTAQASRIISLINQRRANAGLAPVAYNATLTLAAQRFSAVQAQLGRLSHRGVDGSNGGQRIKRAGYYWSYWGENLAAGQETPEALVAAWMASPTHRANILSPKAHEIGIGHTYRESDPNRYFDYWVMEAGRGR